MNGKIIVAATLTLGALLSSVGNAEINSVEVAPKVDGHRIMANAYERQWDRMVRLQLNEVDRVLKSEIHEGQVSGDLFADQEITI